MRSLRRTLLVTLLVAISTVTLTASYLVYLQARREVDTILDYHLRQIALSIPSKVTGHGSLGSTPGAGLDFAIQVWDRNGAKLYQSRPDIGLPDVPTLGFSTASSGSGSWRIYSAELAGLVVQVAQPLSVRQKIAFAAVSGTLAPVLLIIPLLLALVWNIVGRALAPLDRLARDVESRTASALAPFPEADVPKEALPLVRSLNGLLERLGAALSAQRAFVVDAAHELRTPLAVLTLQAQLVSLAQDEHERTAALSDLRAGLDRATHVVQQLLTLARTEPDAAPALSAQPVRLVELVGQAVADHALMAEAKRIDLGAAPSSESAVVSGDLPSLRTLLANLLDNAIRHTPEGSRVDVAAGVLDGRSYLEVADTGPGVPLEERARIFDRFYRRAGSDSGSGLGLAIVKAIADRHRASVALRDTSGGGLTVRVEFPDAIATTPTQQGTGCFKSSLSQVP